MKTSGKVLVLCPYYFPHIGGLESHADEFNKHLSERGYEITVFTPRLPNDALEKEIRFDNVKIIRFPAFEIIPNWFLPKFWKKRYWELLRDINHIDFDIIISRTRFFFTSLMALWYSHCRNIKWVHIEHGSDYIQLSNIIFSVIGRIYDHTIGRLVFKTADEVVANSYASAKFCKKIFKNREYHVIYRGIEEKEITSIKPNAKVSHKYKELIKIVYAGRLIDGKGVSDLIKAFELLNRPNSRLFIIGDGPKMQNLKKQAHKKNIRDRIVFFGQKPKDELIGIVKACDIVVNPSYTEGLPTNMIEAGICGKPVVASDVGGTKEIVHNGVTGYLVTPRSPMELSNKIKLLINNPNLRIEMGKNAADNIKKKYSWKKSIDDYEKIFSKFLCVE